MNNLKFVKALCFFLSFSAEAMQRKPSYTAYIPELVNENGQLVWKLAIKTNNYIPNPRLDLIIKEPPLRLSDIDPENSICTKFPLKFGFTLPLCFYFLKNRTKLDKEWTGIPHTFLLYGCIEKDALYLAQLIHREFELPFIHVKGSQFLDNFHSIGAKKVARALKQRDPKGRPLLLFIEDFDPIAAIPSSDTDYNTEAEWRSSKSSFRFNFDQLKRDPSLILLVSTKNALNLDEGILDRFSGKYIHINSMNFDQRKQLLTHLCNDVSIHDKANTIKTLAYAAKGLSRKSVTKIIKKAVNTLPIPKDLGHQEVLRKDELLAAINKARDEEGISWTAYFNKIRGLIK